MDPTRFDGGSGPTDMSQRAPSGWRWESPQPQGNHLRGLFGVAGATAALDELWAVGDSGTLMRRHKGSWQHEARELLDQRALLAISGSGSGDSLQLLAVGVYEKALLRVAGRWQEVVPPTGGGAGTLTAVWGSPVPGEFYVVGTTGRIYRVRGTIWQREAQDLTTVYLGGVWGQGAGAEQEVYAVGAGGRVLHRRKGGTWVIEADGLTTQQLNAVTGAGGAVYAVGDGGTVLRGQGGTWTVERTPVSANLTAVWGAGDEVFALGQRGTVLRRSAGAWHVENIALTSEHLAAAWGTVRGGQVTLYAVGNLGTVLRRELATWTQLSSRITSRPLSSVWARSADEVYAVGAGGLILRRRGTSPLGAWTTEGEGVTHEDLSAVAGWAATREGGEAEVYAVGAAGTILRRLAGQWVLEGAVLTGQDLTAVWVGPDAVFAVGRGGRIARKQDGRWSLEALPAGVPAVDLLGVWGTGAGPGLVVYAVGAGGLILRRSQGVWAREGDGLTTDALVSVFGRSAEDVYVLGNRSTALRRQGGSWVVEPLQLGGRTPVAGCTVPGTSLYYAIATHGLILRRASTTWSNDAPALTNLELSAISAAAQDDVYIVGPGGLVLHRY
ncbi:MAG: hypothetical protein RMK29_14635 [Myxococcales bacterium]|nr:hypothetical protein [Myxococcota bacterium]MDW8282949.1 hypothetical protein [Myxococcales bacterium]